MAIKNLLDKLAAANIRIALQTTENGEHDLRIRAPKNKLDDTLKKELRDNKQSLISWLLEQEQLASQHQAIKPRIDNDYLPLSFQQQRLWLHCKASGDAIDYHVPSALLIKGELDTKRLQMAFNSLINEESLLRCSIIERKGKPQHQLNDIHIELAEKPMSLASTDIDALAHHAGKWLKQSFPLEKAPLYRITLYRLSDKEPAYLLLMNIHHLITDGWSNQLLLEKLVNHYQAGTITDEAYLSKPDYLDYCLWQTQQLEKGYLQEEISYWKQELADISPFPLFTQTRYPEGDLLEAPVYQSQDLCKSVQQLSLDLDISPFTVYLAAYQLMLAHLNQVNDFACLLPVANRQRPETQNMTGFFVNTLPLKASINWQDTVRQYLKQCHQRVQLANIHSEAPFDAITESLNIYQHNNLTAYFPAIVNYDNSLSLSLPEIKGLSIENIQLPFHEKRFPLTLDIHDNKEPLMQFFIDTRYIEKPFAELFPYYYRRCLEAIIHDTEQCLDNIDMMDVHDRDVMMGLTEEAGSAPVFRHLGSSNRKWVDLSYSKPVIEQFRQQVQTSPDAIAVIDAEEQLDYQSLDSLSTKLAHSIIECIHKPGSRDQSPVIAICMDRSCNLSISLLAILKAGCAYLPIDPQLPEKRIQAILEKSSCAIVVSSEEYHFLFSQQYCIDPDDYLHESHKPNPAYTLPPAESSDDKLFNLIFTSGSTGLPKGVAVREKGIINRLQWMQSCFPLTPGHRVLQKTPISFDVSVWELFWPLLHGATIVFAKPEGHKNPLYLRDLVIEQEVNVIHFVPSMLKIFLDVQDIEDCSSLSVLFCSGENLSTHDARTFHQRLPDCLLYNLYGPTEASIDVTAFQYNNISNLESVPIGKPIDNTQCYILDQQLRPLCPGAIGELYIGGENLASAYYRDEEKTAAAFIDNPWQNNRHTSSRLYKTGDLCRYLPDGNLLFIARNDRQVKVRGLRIELGDIETQLLQFPGINQAAAIPDPIQNKENLVAFYCSPETIQDETLKHFLLDTLPLYMVPARFIPIEKLPLTSHGKLDIKQLEQLAKNQHNNKLDIIQPVNNTERQVHDVWQKQFGHAVNCHEDFFSLGGHSLMASRIIAELSGFFNIDLQFSDIFHYSSIHHLAAHIDQCVTQKKHTPKALQHYPEFPPLSWQQQRLYLFQQLKPDSTAYHMPASFRLKGDLHLHALELAFLQIIKQHQVFRTVYKQHDQQPYQSLLPYEQWTFEFDDISAPGVSGKNEIMMKQLEAFKQRPFRLDSDYCLRAKVVKLEVNEYLLVIVIHHIAADARTLEITARQLHDHYRYFLDHPQASPYKGKSEGKSNQFQYIDYAIWQQTLETDKQLNFWKKQLQGAPEKLAIPHDKSAHNKQGAFDDILHKDIDTSLQNRILAFCQQEKITPFILLLSTYQLFLAKLSQEQDIAVGIPVSGRSHKILQDIPGFFVNSLIMRSRIHHNPDARTWLQEQKQTFMEAMDHQDIPVEKVIELLGYQRHSTFSPIVQTGFNYLQGIEQETDLLQLPGLDIDILDHNKLSAKYDMTWIAYHSQDKLQLHIEYNTSLFTQDTIHEWADAYITLLGNLLEKPELPIKLIQAIKEEKLNEHFRSRFKPMEKVLPLTAMQRDIYIDSLINPGDKQNYIGFLTESTAELDTELWEQSLLALYNASDCLRSSIEKSSMPLAEFAYQLVYPPSVSLPENVYQIVDHDTHFTSDHKSLLIEHALYSDWSGKKRFWRVFIHHFSDGTHLLILAVHHCMFDGVSMQLIGQMMKSNYENLLRHQTLELPQNNFERFISSRRAHTDTHLSYQYWRSQQQSIDQQLDMRPALADKPDTMLDLYHELDHEQWLNLLDFCRTQKTTPAVYFKTLFALTIRKLHSMKKDVLFIETVLGRDKTYWKTLGLCFDQQPNILPANLCKPGKTIADILHYFRKTRKTLQAMTPISVSLQKRLLPQAIPYFFNFYIMESETTFMGKPERVEHLMPLMDHAVNLTAKLVDEKCLLTLSFNQQELDGKVFIQGLLSMHQHIMNGNTDIDALIESPLDGLARIHQCERFQTHASPLRIEAVSKTKHIPPRSAIEASLLDIWQDVLGKQDIGIEDNFFSLGGHSLSAMRIAMRARDEFQIELPLEEIFHKPTIAHIAQLINQGDFRKLRNLPAIEPVFQDDYPLTFAQQRLWFLTQINEANIAYNIPLALSIKGPLDRERLHQSITKTIERQQVLRYRIRQNKNGSEPRLFIADVDRVELGIKNIQRDQLQLVLEEEAQRPFNLQTSNSDILSRFTLIHLDTEENVLLITLHHLIADATSLGILANELVHFYQGSETSLAALPVQYHDYAVWQSQLLHDELIRQQLNYWKKQLANAPLVMGLPTDFPRQDIQSWQGDLHTFSIDKDLSNTIKETSKRLGITPFILGLTAYQIVLSRLAKQNDICIGIPRDGRHDSKLQNLAGFFVNALVIRNDLTLNYTFSELMTNTQNTCHEAFENDLLPAELLIRELELDRQLNVLPFIQAAFNYIHTDSFASQLFANDPQEGTGSFSFDHLTIEPIQLHNHTAKFELLLNLVEHDESLSASIEYNTALYTAETVSNIANMLLDVLDQICENTNQHLYQLMIAAPSREKVNSGEWDRLSLIQKDLYMASLTRPDTLENSIGYALEIPVAVNTDYWKQSLQKLHENYPVLSSDLVALDKDINDGIYLMKKNTVAPLEIIDAPENLQETELQEWIKSLVMTAYQIGHDKLLRNILVRVNEKRYITVLACHHLLMDGRSFTLHAYHLVTNYFHLMEDKPCTFTEDNFQTFVNEQYKSIDTSECIDYWRNKLVNLEPLQYDARHLPASIKTYSQTVDDQHYNSIKKYCKKQGITPSIYFKCLYALMIRFYCRHEDDFALIEFIEGRSRKDRGNIGCHFQRLPVLISSQNINRDITVFFEHLKKLQREQRHQGGLSLKAAQTLLPEGNLPFTYNFYHMPKSGSTRSVDFNGTSFSPELDNNIDFRVQLDLEKLTLSLCYQHSLFDDNHFLQRLLKLSEQLISGVDQAAKLDFKLEREPEVLNGGNSSSVDIISQFSQRASLHPSAIAIYGDDETLSYAKLDDLSNALAHLLLARDISTGQRVVLLIDYRINFMVSLFGIIKSGASYIPINPDIPADRLAYILEDCQADCIISTRSLLDQHAGNIHNHVKTVIDIDRIDLYDYSFEAPAIHIPDDHIFYLIYTSGSTGLPKACCIYTSSFSNLLGWFLETYQFKTSDRCLLMSAPGFDLSQKNYFALLLTGGSLVLPASMHYEPNELLEKIRHHRITTLNCAPSAFYPLLESGGDRAIEALASLRLLLFGGEPIQLQRLSRWIDDNEFDCSVVNMYGPTECTDIATAYRMHPDEIRQRLHNEPASDIPLGKPSAGVSLYVLNEELQQLPPGLVGELCIAGHSVGAGYWQKPALTAEAFIDNPYASGDHDKVLYKTGDLVRLEIINNEPTLFYIGRKDFQLKLHGLRIEPGEIEAALSEIPLIDDARVLVDDEQLLAFALIQASSQENAVDGWREHLMTRLPDYMVPRQLIPVTEWPLTPNGKLDREALLALPRPETSTAFVEPRTDMEKDLAGLWQEVLGIGKVGVFDNFFEAGGDSLAAVRLVARIELHYDIRIPVASLFGAQTIAQLAHVIHNQVADWSPIVPIQPQGNKRPLFAVHAIGAMVLNYEPLSRALGTDQPFFGIQAYGFEEDQTPFTDLDEMVTFYTEAIRQQQPEGPYQLLGHSFGGVIAVEIARKLREQGQEVSFLGLLDSYMPNKYASAAADDALLLKTFAEHNFGVVDIPLRTMRLMKPDAMIKTVAERFNGAVTEDFIRSAIEIIRGFQRMMIAFKPRPVDVPITLFTVQNTLGERAGFLARILFGKNWQSRGWHRYCTELKHYQVHCSHHEIVTSAETLQQLEELLSHDSHHQGK